MSPATNVATPRERVLAEFRRRFGSDAPLLARAPGRVNLIGDHTDYNDGFVLPMAIDRGVWIAFRPRDDRRVVAHSLDFDEDVSFAVGRDAPRAEGWVEYVRAIGWALDDAGRRFAGWDGVVAGDVPVGAGLSSSAAIELAAAYAFTAGAHGAWEPPAMALLAQRAENVQVGVNCGIMDQLISATGVAGHAVLIDCRSLSTRAVPIPSDAAVVVLDTATRRGLVDSAYNERRAQCEHAARTFGVAALRDVDAPAFAARADELDPVTRRRARHVVTEDARTLRAAEALTVGDLVAMGTLMNDSHASLRDDFEVSRRELDAMVDVAQAHAGCYGARMTGAGFGGCAVALVRRAEARRFAADVIGEYERRTGLHPAVYVCAAAEGASVEAAPRGR